MLNSSQGADCPHPAILWNSENWIALSIGNTHWKWGYFEGDRLTRTWTTTALSWETEGSNLDWQGWCARSPAFQWHHQQGCPPFPPLRLASVVQAAQTSWLQYPHVHVFTLADIPIAGLYTGLGIDRALAVFGAGKHYGWPVLVIDAGTALTFSGADEKGFQGGAIAPGVGLQLAMLHQRTDALPQVSRATELPDRWAKDTHHSILGGVMHGTLSTVRDFSQDWLVSHPDSAVLVTGGDGAFLAKLLTQHPLKSAFNNYRYDEHLIFRGFLHCSLSTTNTDDDALENLGR